MWNTNWRRLLGIVVAVPAAFGLFVCLFSNGMVVRGKGFPAPLIDPYHLPESVVCGVVFVVGVCLFHWGSGNSGDKTNRTEQSDKVQNR